MAAGTIMLEHQDEKSLAPVWMFLLAVVVGIFGGLGSIVFWLLIGLFHNLFFYGRLSANYDVLAHMPVSPWGWAVVLVPAIAALIVTWVINTFSPESRGHGVPEVMDAIHYKEGHIRPVVVVTKALASALSIGTGGSVGREGPIIQIGSAFGSVLGQIIAMPPRQRVLLVAAGAAAGIAGTFNAPVAGLAFAVELMLVSVSARAVSLVAVATVTATYITRLYHGTEPSFAVMSLETFVDDSIGMSTLIWCLPFGILIGYVSAAFVKGIFWFEDLFTQHVSNTYLRHFLGMLGIGLMLYGFMRTFGHYYVGGVGYATIMDVLHGSLANPWLLLLLFAAKYLATGFTLGSGASGGVFSPALFMGAAVGSAFGQALRALFPDAGIEPVAFAIAGMAGMVSGATGAVITGITMIFEQTRDYGAILPVIITSALAFVIRERVTIESIYTLKLARRGIWVPKGLEASTAASRHAAAIMSRDFQLVDFEDMANWQATHRPGEGPRHTVVVKDGQLYAVARDEISYLLRDLPLSDVMDTNVFLVNYETTLPVLLRGMHAKSAHRALVMRSRHSTRQEDLLGVISSTEVLDAVQQGVAVMD